MKRQLWYWTVLEFCANIAVVVCTLVVDRKYDVQFNVGRTKPAQVIRKQFPLRPAAAKTIYRSQVDTETRIVVNFSTTGSTSYTLCRAKQSNNSWRLYVANLSENKLQSVVMLKLKWNNCEHRASLAFPFHPFTKSVSLCLSYLISTHDPFHKDIEDVPVPFQCRVYHRPKR